LCRSLAIQQAGASTATAAAAADDSQPPPDSSTEDPAAAAAANSAATAELSRLFDKGDFAVMHPLGQFNLGFIIARLRQDLFIVDQHAAGEVTRVEFCCSTITCRWQVVLREICWK
jgi:DNA mismatch repair ATPase MutL